MRTAADFDQYYATPDPWRASHLSFRDRIFRRWLSDLVSGRRVLELGCGEGHLTATVLSGAQSVTGIDISDVAIERARARRLPSANFQAADFLETPFAGYDVIVALECIYYLSPDEQTAFFTKLKSEHTGNSFVMSAPIIGTNRHRRYFTHAELMDTFARHRMAVEAFHNINVSRTGLLTTAAAVAVRMAPFILDWLPEPIVYQRLYKVRTN